MNLEKAIKIALEAHIGQVDKGGNPYILHPLPVMLSLNSEEERIVGVLHDVVEDCEGWQGIGLKKRVTLMRSSRLLKVSAKLKAQPQSSFAKRSNSTSTILNELMMLFGCPNIPSLN